MITDTDRFVVLTQHQAKVLAGLLQGKTQAQIAAEIGKSPQAVGKTVSQLRSKGFVLPTTRTPDHQGQGSRSSL
jgi:DNA-binding NarL/FixJ family response regulator